MNEENNSVDFAVTVKSIRDNILCHIELAQLNARIWHARYAALVKQGFSEDQALQLCTKYG